MLHRIKRETWRYQSHNVHTGEYESGFYTKKNSKKISWKFIKMNKAKLLPFRTEKYNIYFIELFDYLEYHTNRLVSKKAVRLREPLRRSNLATIFGVERTTVYRFLKEADELNIIKYVKEDKSYYVNPDIIARGNEVSKGVFDLFKEE